MSKEVELSARLKALTDMVSAGSRVCDVGCDHGFLSIYLVQKHIAPKAIAMDLRSGPLSRAREHIRKAGLEEYIEVRLGDGVSALRDGEADALVLAGMGGRLVMRILDEGRDKCRRLRELILQPQSDIPQVRRFLRKEGYQIVDEAALEEDGKFYFLMKAVWQDAPLPEEDPLGEEYGAILLERRDPALHAYLRYREGLVEKIRQGLLSQGTQKAAGRLKEVEEELAGIRQALGLWDA